MSHSNDNGAAPRRLAAAAGALVALSGCSSGVMTFSSDGGAPDSGSVAHADAGQTDTGAQPGETHILIADQYNNRVIEIDRAGKILWTFGNGNASPGPESVVGPNDAERLPNGDTLIAGTGVPGGTTDTACVDKNGCTDNRVFIVNSKKSIVWQFDGALNTPVAARQLVNGDVLIVDQGNNRVLEVTETMPARVVWEYPPAQVVVASAVALDGPNSAERLANGHTLIADENANRVIEVDDAGTTVWQYPLKPVRGKNATLDGPAFASRLPNGHTLITDSNNNRVIEVSGGGSPQVVWSYDTNVPGEKAASNPTRAVRLLDGHTLISEQGGDRVIEVDHASPAHVVFTYGKLDMPGAAPGELNGPYDAKVVGDYTGMSLPQLHVLAE